MADDKVNKDNTVSIIEEIVKRRYSCRTYRDTPLSNSDRVNLGEFASQKITGPFGGSAKFTIIASEPNDSAMLKGLGTYGVIKNPAAFITGVVKESEMNLEDFGYSMERIILHVTEMGLGSCWLGGTFKKSSFAGKAGIAADEIIPAVTSIGYIADKKSITEMIVGGGSGKKKRKDAAELFFDNSLNVIQINFNEGYGLALEMLRLAPSASNMQPWRVVKENGKNKFHFFLERTVSYTWSMKLFRLADMQRIDMGIAMCHFESAAIESGLRGVWIKERPAEINTPSGWEYSITWDGE